MKKSLKYLLPVLVMIIIMSLIYVILGMYPFGSKSIVRVDADFQFIPVLYKIYDFLHGNFNIIYDDIGFGNNIFISMVLQGSFFSPVNLLLYFTSRENIVYYFNIIVLAKFCLIALTTYIYIDRNFKINTFYKVLGSVLYTFNGFVLLNFFSVMWLDCVILFPLIILYLDELLYKNKYMGYIIVLTLSLIISYYISYFILVFILFYGFNCIFIKIKKENRKQIIYRLGICTFISIMLSSFCLLPSLYQTLISSRFGSVNFCNFFDNLMLKSLHVLLSPFFVILTILYIEKMKKDKYNETHFVLLLILYVMGIFIEPINLTLHGGSYWDFPYRYGFITSFIIMVLGLRYIEKFDFNNKRNYSLLKIIMFVVVAFFVIYLNSRYLDNIVKSQIVLNFHDLPIYINLIEIILMIFMLYYISISFSNKYVRYIFIGISSLISIIIFCFWTMTYEPGYFLSINANKINNKLDIKHDGRYKVEYTTYCPDYGFILNVPTLDNWIHIIPEKELRAYESLGYRVSDTGINSYGGTAFTDWLFNTKYLFSRDEKSDLLYKDIDKYVDKYDEKYLYQYKFDSAPGVVFNGKMPENDFLVFENQNNIYKSLFNTDSKDYHIDYSDELEIDYNITEPGLLYFYSNSDYDIEYVKINDRYIHVDNDDIYINDLGLYDKDINIEIKLEDNNYFDFKLGFIKLTDILNLNSSVEYDNKRYHTYAKNNDSYLFLPINNIKGLRAYVNNKEVKINNYFDNFVSIKLDKGENYVKIKYGMPLFKIGIIVSIFGVLLLIFIKKYIIYDGVFINITYYVYILLVIILFLYYYVYSVIKRLLL